MWYRQIPNCLTGSRLLAAPFILSLFLAPPFEDKLAGTILFALAGSTDFFDGKLARLLKCESELGRILDPIGDKVLCWSAALSIAANVHLNLWLIVSFVIIGAYDVGITVCRYGFGIRLPTTKGAKRKTTALILGFCIELFGIALQNELIEIIALNVIILGAALAVVSAAKYTADHFHHRSLFRAYGTPPL